MALAATVILILCMDEKLRCTNSSASRDQNPRFYPFIFTVALYCTQLKVEVMVNPLRAVDFLIWAAHQNI